MANNKPSNIQVSDNILWMFATPVVAYQWHDMEDINRDLASQILDREKEDKSGVKFSNAGGWQSSKDLLNWGTSATNELKHRIETLLSSVLIETSSEPKKHPKTRLAIDCWANINREGDYNIVHNHPNSLWSGVYYVSAGNPDPSSPHAGKIELLDPRSAAGFIQINQTIMDQKCFLQNDPGMMLLFPSWVKHMVHPHKGTEPRISIAFNVLPVF